VKTLCDDIGLPTGIKTSGSTGLHVLIPLGRQCTYEQSRTLGGLLARVISAELPEIATVTRQCKSGAEGLPRLRPERSRPSASGPVQCAASPGSPGINPARLARGDSKLEIRKFTIRTVPARMKKLKQDPLIAIMDEKPDLMSALERLHARL
jgi:bifunctional non-homologous end joining protein LigD